MTKGIDFTNCPRVFDRAYNGANGKRLLWNMTADRIC